MASFPRWRMEGTRMQSTDLHRMSRSGTCALFLNDRFSTRLERRNFNAVGKSNTPLDMNSSSREALEFDFSNATGLAARKTRGYIGRNSQSSKSEVNQVSGFLKTKTSRNALTNPNRISNLFSIAREDDMIHSSAIRNKTEEPRNQKVAFVP